MVSGPYDDSRGQDRGWLVRVALLATVMWSTDPAAGRAQSPDEMPPRVANSLEYADALLGVGGEGPAVPTGTYSTAVPVAARPPLDAVPPIDLPALPPENQAPPAPRPRPEAAPVATAIPPAEEVAIRRGAVPATTLPAASFDVPSDASSVPAGAEPDRTDAGVERVSCASCGGTGHLGHAMAGPGGMGGSCSTCGGSGVCVPGRGPCYAPGFGDSFCGRFLSNLYECLCCPDPCYQPAWVPEANASFFTDPARPRTMTRFRWDRGWDMQTPDRAEFFWARQSDRPRQGPPGLPGRGVPERESGWGQGAALPGE